MSVAHNICVSEAVKMTFDSERMQMNWLHKNATAIQGSLKLFLRTSVVCTHAIPRRGLH